MQRSIIQSYIVEEEYKIVTICNQSIVTFKPLILVMSTVIYSVPNLTRNVRLRDGERGQRGNTVNSGQIEGRGQMEDRGQIPESVVHIYENLSDVRSPDVISGPRDRRMNSAGRHTQSEFDNVENRSVISMF